ncbi:uncharacterized protein PITG_22123 [Phytophthora infestans T30-4]|uniref:Uncharacterized protein n=1 Tax=Phytophthora infestans (strain T30-4) TaxID=403677 RepID=D0P4Y9_PHYIT|nr:uncharacterized protein PITG_22123 [Phytophthora infestans T30-4]EEY54700.1 conserved hypothetical protein [Phytophthora infestans T30-4]|eukprot:XP_002894709.1 conserved hypothetical protein [Phytophthora infestans T30-4]
MTCRARTKSDEQCSREALPSGYCFQHEKDYKTQLFKKKLKKMHRRVRTLSEKLNAYHRMIVDINRCDYIKYRLDQLEQHTPYRFICNDPRSKEEIEEIFDLAFDECQQSYISLLERRNAIIEYKPRFRN